MTCLLNSSHECRLQPLLSEGAPARLRPGRGSLRPHRPGISPHTRTLGTLVRHCDCCEARQRRALARTARAWEALVTLSPWASACRAQSSPRCCGPHTWVWSARTDPAARPLGRGQVSRHRPVHGTCALLRAQVALQPPLLSPECRAHSTGSQARHQISVPGHFSSALVTSVLCFTSSDHCWGAGGSVHPLST